MYSDDVVVQQLLALLKAHNVRHVVIAPGSRHYAFTRSFEADGEFELYSVVDERSAAFFALGLIQKLEQPVAVLCTSGTASINFGSAVAEAFYQDLPLLVLTADRLPELLGQMEDQMLPQQNLFEDITRYRGQLKEVSTDLDAWYCNRVINEGLLALRHKGGGPVHLNIPIRSHAHDSFSTKQLPKPRVINRVGTRMEDDARWDEAAGRLAGRRVLVLWGQSAPPSPDLLLALERFVGSHDALVFADHLSNLHSDARIDNTYSLLMGASERDRINLAPDIVISLFGNFVFDGEVRSFLATGGSFEHWRVAPDGEIVDPFRHLTDVFEASPQEFFERLAGSRPSKRSAYRQEIKSIADTIAVPAVAYSEISVIGKFMELIPPKSVLAIANSAPIRITQLFPIDGSVEVICNRGVNGIDGSMSAAVGYATQTDALTFLIIGDLSFFYDMNSLWIRHVPKNLRILLMNNSGGAVMHVPLPATLGPSLGEHVSAQHGSSAKGWVESLNFKYYDVHSEADQAAAMSALVDPKLGVPVVVEVFTDRMLDVAILKDHWNGLKRSKRNQVARSIPRQLRFAIPALRWLWRSYSAFRK